MSPRIARQRDPAERALALAEQRADVLGHESGNVERVRDARVERHRAHVVAVIERHRAAAPQLQHGPHVDRRRLHCARDVRGGVGHAERQCLRQRHARRHIAVQRVVRARLIGEDIRDHAAPHEFRQDIRGVAHEADGKRRARTLRRSQPRERLVEIRVIRSQ